MSQRTISKKHTSEPNGEPMSGIGIDKSAIYQTILRILVRLEESDYTDHTVRQVEVMEHNDPPNPASDEHISQG